MVPVAETAALVVQEKSIAVSKPYIADASQ